MYGQAFLTCVIFSLKSTSGPRVGFQTINDDVSQNVILVILILWAKGQRVELMYSPVFVKFYEKI